MIDKFKVGDKVVVNKWKSSGYILQVLTSSYGRYKVRVDDVTLTFSSNELSYDKQWYRENRLNKLLNIDV